MAVPVQMWGSMGSLIAEQKEFGATTAEYLETNQVYDLFAHLLRQVVIHQPDNPLRFLQDQLRAKPPMAIAVIGPPGVNRSKYCQQIASDYKIKHIHVGKLIRARKDLKEVIEAGNLVDDNIVVDVVRAALESSGATGFVLDGFPRTKLQAQALSMKELGSCPDRIILLHTGEKVIRQRYAAKVATLGLGAVEKEEVINMRIQQYQRHVLSICEFYRNIIRQVEVGAGEEDANIAYATVKSNLHIQPLSVAPLRMHRVCIVGPCASGRTTQSRALASHYGLVHVDLAALVRKHQQATGLKLEDVPTEYVSDEELCALVGRRLSEIDCLRKGWILDGFPKTQRQAEFLRQSHLWPTRLLHLKVHEDTSIQRASGRRVDPVTGTGYYRSPANVAVRQRLVLADHDAPEQARERFKTHMDHVDKVMQTFPMVFSTVSADTDIASLTKLLQDKISKPLPSEVSQAAEDDAD